MPQRILTIPHSSGRKNYYKDAELYLPSKIDYSGSSSYMFFVIADGRDGGPDPEILTR
jgi:hypothetical protein